MDKFRSIATADIGNVEVWVGENTLRIDVMDFGSRGELSLNEARALRDWLNSALPEESDRWRQRGSIVGVIVRDEDGKDWKWDGRDWAAVTPVDGRAES
jgi:hypothetical protein